MSVGDVHPGPKRLVDILRIGNREEDGRFDGRGVYRGVVRLVA